MTSMKDRTVKTMARPMRKDADYFPFICKEGKTFSILRSRYPLEGVGFFTELCIILTTTPDHHIVLKDDLDFEYFASRINCEKEKAEIIIDLLVRTQKIHPDLWNNARVIVIPDLLDSLKDAYERRNNDIITIDKLVSDYINEVNVDINKDYDIQKPTKDSKVNKSKVNDSIVKRFTKPTVEELTAYCKERNNNIDGEYFYNYYKSKGWMIGKNKMKNWKSAIATWEKRDFNKGIDKKADTDNTDISVLFAGNEDLI